MTGEVQPSSLDSMIAYTALPSSRTIRIWPTGSSQRQGVRVDRPLQAGLRHVQVAADRGQGDVTPVDRTSGGRRRYHELDLEWIVICTRLRATGMSIKEIRRYAELVSAGHGNEKERLALMEAHRANVIAKLAEVQEHLKLIDHKIDVYRGRLEAGDADRLWAPNRLADAG